MKTPANLGMLLLAVWLIRLGSVGPSVSGITFAYSGDVLAVLAIVVGVLLLMRR